MEDPREAGEGFWFKAGLRLIIILISPAAIANVALAYMPGLNSRYLLLGAWVGGFTRNIIGTGSVGYAQ